MRESEREGWRERSERSREGGRERRGEERDTYTHVPSNISVDTVGRVLNA